MNKRRGSGPNVEWVGIIVRTDDGNVHAVELKSGVGNFITADLIITKNSYRVTDELDINAVIRGRGRYWVEGANMGPTTSERKKIESAGEALGRAMAINTDRRKKAATEGEVL